jgi:DNA-binding response OmpR family regulator
VSAITATRSVMPTLMILDLGMPDGDGFVVMRRLGELGITKDVPIVILTGSDSERDRRRALESGAVTFLQKPVDNAVLGATLRGASVRASSRRDSRV